MRSILRRVVTPLSALLLLAACGDTTRPDPFDPTQLPEGTAVEPWGIGDSWYDYSFNSHMVTPSDLGWVITHVDGPTYHVVVDNYYGPTGNPASPKISIRTWNGDGWSAPRSWQAPRSLNEKNQEPMLCLTLDDAESVSCSATYDMIWRINQRPVPEMGFAAKNPGMFVNRQPGTKVFQIIGKTPPETPPTAEVESEVEGAPKPVSLVRSIFDVDAKPLLPFQRLKEGGSIFMLTTHLHISEWTVTEDEDDANALVVRARCVDAKPSQGATAALDMPPGELRLEGERQQWSFIYLCGEEGAPVLVESRDTLKVGQWPENGSFGLVIQTVDGQTNVWVSPDQPIDVRKESAAFEDTAPPASLWSIP